MQTKDISINSIEKAKNFVNLAEKYKVDIDVKSGSIIIDAKSLLGVLSLDLRNPMIMQIHDDNININDFAAFFNN
jgi:phosphocarrier protein